MFIRSKTTEPSVLGRGIHIRLVRKVIVRPLTFKPRITSTRAAHGLTGPKPDDTIEHRPRASITTLRVSLCWVSNRSYRLETLLDLTPDVFEITDFCIQSDQISTSTTSFG